MSRAWKFWIAVAASFVIGMIYPVAIWLGQQPWKDSRLWIQNDPGFTVFLPLIVPFAVATLVVNLDLAPLKRISRPRRVLMLGVLLVLVALALMVTMLDFNNQLASPIQYQNAVQVLEQEQVLRHEVREAVKAVHEAPTEAARDAARVDLAAMIKTARDEYAASWPRINSLSALAEFGAPAAWAVLFLNGVASLFLAVFFWYCWVLVQFRRDWSASSYDWLLLAIGLLVTWFPLRLYSEWYLHFFSLQGMDGYGVFGFLMAVAVLAYLFVAFKVAAKLSVKIFATAATALIGIVTTIGQVAPDWLEGIAFFLERWDFRLYLVLLVLITLALSAMVWTLLEDGTTTTPRRPKRTRAAAAG